MSVVASTLYEGDYHHGVAALANSLVAHGYRGTFHVGYRGSLPPWSPWPGATGDRSFQLTPEVAIAFVEEPTSRHLSAHKPWLLEGLLDRYPDAEGVVYLDPDIVVACDWSTIASWVSGGVALCEDMLGRMHRYHPARIAWRRILPMMGLEVSHETDLYINSGFVGVSRTNRSFLARWAHVIAELERLTGLPMAFCRDNPLDGKPEGWQPTEVYMLAASLPKGPWQRFCDQVAMNMALMCTDEPLTVVGEAAMFGGGPYLTFLPHAYGKTKPWQRGLWGTAFVWRRMTFADRAYWRNVDGPIAVHTPFNRLAFRARDAIGRFISLVRR